MEQLAEIERAHVHGFGHLLQRQILRVIVVNELLGTSDDVRFSRFHPDQKLIADHRQVLGENAQQANKRGILLGRQDSRAQIRIPQFRRVHIHSPVADHPGRAVEISRRGLGQEDLAGVEETDELFAQAHGHSRLGYARATDHGVRLVDGLLAKLLPNSQTIGTGGALPGHDRAEPTLVFGCLVLKLPELDGPQAQGQPRRFSEDSLVILINRGLGEGINHAVIIIHRNRELAHLVTIQRLLSCVHGVKPYLRTDDVPGFARYPANWEVAGDELVVVHSQGRLPAVLRGLAAALLLLGGLKMAQAATVTVPLNGLMVTLDAVSGSILRLVYPGVGVLLEADLEEAGLVDAAYPLPDFEPLRLAVLRSSGAEIQQSPGRVIVRIPALGATRSDFAIEGSVRAEVTLRGSSDGRSVIFSCQITNGTRRPIPQVIFPDLRGLVDVAGPDLERGNESEVTVEDAPQNRYTRTQVNEAMVSLSSCTEIGLSNTLSMSCARLCG